jgi:hypothetical protein
VTSMMDEVLSECVHLGNPLSACFVYRRRHYTDCASGAARTPATAYYGGALSSCFTVARRSQG